MVSKVSNDAISHAAFPQLQESRSNIGDRRAEAAKDSRHRCERHIDQASYGSL
jgi:hypothetical protein